MCHIGVVNKETEMFRVRFYDENDNIALEVFVRARNGSSAVKKARTPATASAWASFLKV